MPAVNNTQRIGTPSFRESFTQCSRVSGSAFVLSFFFLLARSASFRSIEVAGHLKERVALRTDDNRYFSLNELRCHL